MSDLCEKHNHPQKSIGCFWTKENCPYCLSDKYRVALEKIISLDYDEQLRDIKAIARRALT